VNFALLSEDAADSKAVNVGSTDNIEILTLAEKIRDRIAPDTDLEFTDRHDADVEHTRADTAKTAELLGYEPSHTIREGVDAFIE
jgi:UDP-glucose 4-epimerase